MTTTQETSRSLADRLAGVRTAAAPALSESELTVIAQAVEALRRDGNESLELTVDIGAEDLETLRELPDVTIDGYTQLSPEARQDYAVTIAIELPERA